MIVEPDFLNHYKVKTLVRETKDKAAPLYILRLWFHCQFRREYIFKDLSPEILAGICEWDGDQGEFMALLLRLGFLSKNGEAIEVHGFEEKNSKMVANWKNGCFGGRPEKPKQNPPITHPKPTDNPPIILVEPTDNRVGEGRVGEGRVGEGWKKTVGAFAPPTIEEAEAFGKTIGMNPKDIHDFFDHFTSNGWKVGGKAPMKDWKAAQRKWSRNCFKPTNASAKPLTPEEKLYSRAAL